MPIDLSHHAERVLQNRAAREARNLAAPGSLEAFGAGDAGTFTAGARVFDTRTGFEGVVERGANAIIEAPTVIVVRLASGDIVMRTPSELIWRPTPPTAR